jgi:Protein of unknown function (DUF3108)
MIRANEAALRRAIASSRAGSFMSFVSRVVAFAAAVALTPALTLPAPAQATLSARYAISLAGLSVGKAEWTVTVRPDAFAISASGRASGMLRVLLSGEGSAAVIGGIEQGRPVPAQFTSDVTRDADRLEFRMVLAKGTVQELSAGAPAPGEDRIAVTDEHRSGVLDPLSAMLMPVDGPGDPLTAAACERTLPIFDGQRRFDLTLAFQRIDKVKAGKDYEGPALVCSARFRPIAGHRPSSSLMKYLSEANGVELWLVPVAGTRLLAPFRLASASMIGSLLVDAVAFETGLAVAGNQVSGVK